MNRKWVCVLDMDETLGFYDSNTFHVRPKFKAFINFLKLIHADIILWSMGSDSYVHRIVNGFLPDLRDHLFKLFGRSECEYSTTYYQFPKASAHIRDLYPSLSIFLIGIDDKVTENMDEQYDLRIYIKPYTKVNSCDKELMLVMEKMIEGISNQVSPQDVERSTIPENNLQFTDEMEMSTVAQRTRCRAI